MIILNPQPTNGTSSNSPIRTISFGGKSYDIVVDKDWQQSDSSLRSYITDKTHYIDFIEGNGTPLDPDMQATLDTSVTGYVMASDITEEGKPNAVDRVFLIRGPHYVKLDNSADYSCETVSYAIYIPNSVYTEHRLCETGHSPIKIPLPLLNSINEAKSVDECYTEVWFEPNSSSNYRLSLVLDPSLQDRDIQNIVFGEARIKQLDTAYIPFDPETITLTESGKLTVAPIASRLSAVENSLAYFLVLFGGDNANTNTQLENIIDQDTLGVIEDKAGKHKLSAQVALDKAKQYTDSVKSEIVGTSEDAQTQNTIYGTRAAIEAEATVARAAENALSERIDCIDFIDETELSNAISTAKDEVIAYTDNSQKALLGLEDDTADKNTVYGAKAAVKALEESLKSIAKSGKASDVSLEDLSNKITADNVEDALIELKDNITNSWNVLFGQDRQTIVLDGGTDGAKSETAE